MPFIVMPFGNVGNYGALGVFSPKRKSQPALSVSGEIGKGKKY
jgi:hypothetical protein